MPKNVTDGVLGARASNAGDRFHELWALRKALTLLEPSSPYSAITVEGVPETDTPPDEIAWSAVDVCLLTGGTRIQDASKVEFAQLKYSSTNPTSAWTAARLSHSSAKKGNNSVIKRLADVYAAAEAEKKSTNPKLSYSIRLVSNQPVSPEVLQALGQAAAHANDKVRADKNRTQLLSATGLTKGEFKRFAAQLDFSECGASSLFEQEKQAIQALDRMTEGDSRGTHLELLSFISGAMLPTGSREPITEEVLLSHLGIGTERSLYPCPNLVKSLSVIVERPVVGQVVQSLVAGTQHLCVQGGAGCGKTTAVAQLGQKLPSGSVCILFDCYGGGSYLDESAPRHRPVEAFTQLANEVATRLKVPRLLRLADKGLPAKAFKDRLTLAAHVLREANPGALLVIAIDAADNAVTAAEKRDEHCFVRELATFTDLPDNVRIVITARPSRVASLDLPPYFSFQTIEAFDVNETLSNVRNYIQNPDSVWVREFHDLSRGNPRVQAYAFGFSTVPRDAIQFLLPSGKELGDVFAASVYSAWQKNGGLASVEQLCAALIALPRPVPLTELAHAIVADATLVAELCQDLYPTLVVKAGTVSFADEDFEDFVRDRGANALKTVQSRIATGLMDRACHNEYAARHVVHALISAGKKREALRFASDEESLALLRDPMERRLCQLDRMRSAIRVCEETNSKPDSLFILLTGAEALRTTDAITKELANNCDLAIRHARDTVERLVLGDEEYFEAHGPLFFHAMAEDSKQKLFAQVDRSHRLFIAWNERNRHSRSYRKHHQNLTVRDVAAYFRAILVTRGPQEMLSRARRRLGSDRLRVITEVVGQLLEEGNVALVESVTREATSWHSLGLLVQAMLMAAGCEVALSDIEKSLLRFQTRGRFLASTSARRQASGFLTRLPDEYVLGLSEALSRSKASQAVVRNVLGDMLADETPRWKSIRPSDYERMDTVLRAECLLAALHVESVEVSKLWGVPTSEMRQSWQSTSGISHEDHQRRSKLVELTAALLPYYQARAQYVISGRGSDFWGNENPAWLGKLIDGSYLADAQGKLSIRFRVAASTSSLTMLHGADAPKLLSLVIALLDENRPTFEHRELEILRTFAWRSETHSQLAQFADKRRAAISAAKTSSSEKASSLLELSRLLLECCPAESASLFNAAVLVLGS